MGLSVFVATGTGKQGRTTARQLLERGHEVHILARNSESNEAKALKALGAVVHVGDLNSQDTIAPALKGIEAVFLAFPAHPTAEVDQARNVINAAKENGVKTFVYNSVARTGEHESFPGWNKDFPLAWYWINKDAIETLVRTAGFENWTILQPAFFFQNFCQPDVDFMFPELAVKHHINIAFHPDTKLDLINLPDIAKFVVAVIESPKKFSGKSIPLAVEKLTISEIAEQLSIISGEKITVNYLSDEEALEQQKQGNILVDTQVWQRDFGYGVDIEATEAYGVPFEPLSKGLDRKTLGW